MNMASRIILIIAALLLTMSGYAFGSDIAIGMSLSLTGRYAEMGNMQQKGLFLWEKHVNEKGGILGRNVKIIIMDDKSSKERAKNIYKRLIEKDKVDFVIGPYSSGISEAILPVTEKNRYPVLLSGASADRLWEKGYRYAFGIYTPASKYTSGFLQMLVKQKIENIAIISAEDTFSVSLSKGTRKWAQRFKLNVACFQVFKKGQKHLADIALRAKESGSQAVIVCGHLNESVDMRLALKKIGWYPEAYYASVGPATRQFYNILKDDSNLTFSSSQWEESVGIRFPQGEEFIKAFHKYYKISPSYHAATAYAAGMILEAALEKSGSLDKEDLRETLFSLDTMTVIGRYGVDKKGKQKRHFPLIIQWQNKKKNVVWPDSLKELDPVFQ
ncbi:MAG: amino acid ABC transporter substrate-binding protein [Deltaproteobacteria bacterium]|nr:amino acid ABC transporter substrate-binding protein [Deltaproteobacteria bacterium]